MQLGLGTLFEPSNIMNKLCPSHFPRISSGSCEGILLEFGYFVCHLHAIPPGWYHELTPLRNMLSKYPGSEKYILYGISFRFEQG
jgi:hypothetical protein